MIDANSNCSRVDAVKALAGQLKLQSAPKLASGDPGSASGADGSQKIKSDFQDVEEAVRANDAKKAEQALAVVRNDLAAAQNSEQKNSENKNAAGQQPFRGLDAYA
jgi:hypothetical protein